PIQASSSAYITVVHPLEGARLPPLKDVFVFGAVIPGSTLTVNGSTIPVHPKGGYLTMVPLSPGDVLLSMDAKAPGLLPAHLDRRFTVSPGYTVLPATSSAIVRDSISPADDMLLAVGDTVRVSFQGSPFGTAEFAIGKMAQHIPMLDNTARGFYEGSY